MLLLQIAGYLIHAESQAEGSDVGIGEFAVRIGMAKCFGRAPEKIAYIFFKKDKQRIIPCGKSGYNIWKLINLWSNFTGFTVVPLRIAGFSGIIISAAAFIWAIVLIIKRIAGLTTVSGYTSLMCLMLLAFGTVLACIGLLGEYVGRIFMAVNKTPQFIPKEIYHGKES